MERDDHERLEFLCPTFTTTDESANTAARVATSAYLEDSDADFEFDLVRADVSLDDVLRGGADVFPVFNRDLVIGDSGRAEDAVSSASSDDDELEGVAAGSYCMWRPRKAEEASPGRVKKSESSGSGSKRWKLLDLLRRSNSDGKGNFVFLAPKNRDAVKSTTDSKGNFVFLTPKNGDPVKSTADSKGNFVFLAAKNKDAVKSNREEGSAVIVKKRMKGSAVEEFYAQNRASKEGQKRKSYLPYKKVLVGFFANVQGTRYHNFGL